MALEIRNLGKKFHNSDEYTLKNVNLTIEAGEFVCIVGQSGCGKSTLLNLVAGLDQPTEGEILLDGEKVTAPGTDRTVMFQEHALFPWLNVIDNVKFGMKLAGISETVQEEKAMYYLEMVQLEKYINYRIHELSGGMRQRVALARALTLDSKMLLMDEPFSALDKQTANTMREELEKIWLQTKKTILFITHSVEEAIYLADRVVVLSEKGGKIKRIVPVDLLRPRKVSDLRLVQLRQQILDEIRSARKTDDEILADRMELEAEGGKDTAEREG